MHGFPERMDGVQFGKEVRRILRKRLVVEPTKIIPSGKRGKERLHLRIDEFREAKRVAALGDADTPGPAGPVVDILEQVVVNRRVVRVVKRTAR